MKYCNVTTFNISTVSYCADPIPPKTIIGIVAQYCKLTVREIVGESRDTEKAEARQIAMHFIKRYNPGITLKAVGELFNRDHSTVVYSYSVFENLVKYDRSYRKKVKDISERLLTIDRLTTF